MFCNQAMKFAWGEIWEDANVGTSICFDKESCNTPYYLIILVSSGCLGIESPEL